MEIHVGEGTQFDILSGQLFGYKGPIFENLVAGMLAKTGRRLYFFEKQQNRLEVDFVIKWKGRTALVEAKASQGKTRSTTTILRHPEKFTSNRPSSWAIIRLGALETS